MKIKSKLVLCLIAGLMLSGVSANAVGITEKPGMGSIRGRVVNESNEILPGATIVIEELHSGVTSDANGFYNFSNIKPGTYNVTIRYVGYSPIKTKITIPNDKAVEKVFTLSEGIELKEIQVSGAFQGQRKALSMQQNAMGISNVVCADEVGKFPDSNIGDALKRINGVNVQYDQGEARFGQVRGTSADLTSVTINGNRVPSAEGDTRNVQLDLICRHDSLQQTMDFTLDGEHHFGNMKMDWAGSYSRAMEDRPEERYLGVVMKGKKNTRVSQASTL